ncbi:XTP/dITP diphosphatase [Geobacter sp. SVR]|uniref:XTP/dITP diphosphatase n=1 Tax=Geobacter sp. SVR TaxID=2495594 RepID=UPI00143F00B1|nr:XTP/dITP diphosphatase [Geobacter sp. SVR]BCS54239.1 non-canonical purine NTP pyrophosphatase [Geobacter sp. SVR]GCF85903.1 non-canonical purine NTP pyrophosphatase [Geobacter sp. SVR]
MKELVIATRNRGKMKEIEAFLAGLVERVTCAADFEAFPETVEDGATFEANALKKAREAMKFTGLPALADDSGLVVDALDGRPGVYSARFAGEGADDAANNRTLLHELAGVSPERRQAAFVCALAFISPEGEEKVFYGRVGGCILAEARGEGGFGYDPLFLVDGFGRTMAELSVDEKNRISHRGQALRQFREYLE